VTEVREPDDLYALPLEEFTAARNELARSLKAAGDADEAARVKKLKKPPVSAWAVNQLARDDPGLGGQPARARRSRLDCPPPRPRRPVEGGGVGRRHPPARARTS
jgi:hypothetical protein